MATKAGTAHTESASGSGVPAGGLVRCVCRDCGSHVHAVVLQQTISGICRTCGSCDVTRLST